MILLTKILFRQQIEINMLNMKNRTCYVCKRNQNKLVDYIA